MSVATGQDTIAAAFAAAHTQRTSSAGTGGRRAALMPYLMGGFPDIGTSLAIGRAYAEAGADLVELGVPFSDPLADGPVIHAAGTRALESGATLHGVLEVGRELAESVPVVLMCYANLMFARGPERFAGELAERGISGLIVPDLPLEEARGALAACDTAGIALVALVAPTTPDERLAAIGRSARGFVYLVSVTGTTGERERGPAGLAAMVERTKARTDVPVAVGFGIGTPDAASGAADAGADGVIVGSRLVRAASESSDPAAAVAELVSGFAAALR